jgi:hypothetical protein
MRYNAQICIQSPCKSIELLQLLTVAYVMPPCEWKRLQLLCFTINDVTHCTEGMCDRWQQVLALGGLEQIRRQFCVSKKKKKYITVSWATQEFCPYSYVLRKKSQSQCQKEDEKCYCSFLQGVMHHKPAPESGHIIQ